MSCLIPSFKKYGIIKIPEMYNNWATLGKQENFLTLRRFLYWALEMLRAHPALMREPEIFFGWEQVQCKLFNRQLIPAIQ